MPGVVDILVATIDAEPDKLAEDLAHHPPSVVVAHPGAMEALTYDLGGTVLLAQHWEEDPSMVLKQIEVLQSVSTAPAIAGPYAAVAADYHARYAYTPEAVAPAEAELRVVHTGYVAPYWYGFPHHRNYLGASLGWHLDATDVRVDNTAQPVSAHVAAYTGRQSAPPPAVTD